MSILSTLDPCTIIPRIAAGSGAIRDSRGFDEILEPTTKSIARDQVSGLRREFGFRVAAPVLADPGLRQQLPQGATRRRVERRKIDAGDLVCIDPYVLEFRAAPIDERKLEQGDDFVADSARLVALEGHFYRTHIALPTTRVVLGRSETADIVIPDRAVSLNHAEIRNVGGTYVLRDLGSPLGTEVNGARIREACLTHGDRIRIGSTVYWFDVMSRRSVSGEPAASASDEDTVPLVIV
jgi:hypothetical protein